MGLRALVGGVTLSGGCSGPGWGGRRGRGLAGCRRSDPDGGNELPGSCLGILPAAGGVLDGGSQ